MEFAELFFSYKGRIPRSSYWFGQIGLNIGFGALFIAAIYAAYALGDGTRFTEGVPDLNKLGPVAITLSVILYIISIYSSFALCAKRCHDLGRSGWFSLLMIVPLLNFWPFIELGFLRGEASPNQWGPDPLGGSQSWLGGDELGRATSAAR